MEGLVHDPAANLTGRARPGTARRAAERASAPVVFGFCSTAGWLLAACTRRGARGCCTSPPSLSRMLLRVSNCFPRGLSSGVYMYRNAAGSPWSRLSSARAAAAKQRSSERPVGRPRRRASRSTSRSTSRIPPQPALSVVQRCASCAYLNRLSRHLDSRQRAARERPAPLLPARHTLVPGRRFGDPESSFRSIWKACYQEANDQ